MRFTIRHLLWFTLLAAVGCWWWLPSDNDAIGEFAGDFSSFEKRQRFRSKESMTGVAAGLFAECKMDFRNRDVVVMTLDRYGSWAHVRSRGAGSLVLVLPSESSLRTCDIMLSVAKYANVIRVTETQANLIDAIVAAGLLTLAIGSLFVGRKRRAE